MPRLVRVTPPAVTPVSLVEAKAHLRVDHSDDDALITALIEAATGHLDGWTGILGRALINQTWRVDVPAWGYPLRLPLGPVQSVTSVAYWDVNNTDAVFAAERYSLHTDALGAAIHLNSGSSWPSVYSRQDAIRVTFVAGYGLAAADVPAPIRQAILLLVGHWYANREAVVSGNFEQLPLAVNALLTPLRATNL